MSWRSGEQFINDQIWKLRARPKPAWVWNVKRAQWTTTFRVVATKEIFLSQFWARRTVTICKCLLAVCHLICLPRRLRNLWDMFVWKLHSCSGRAALCVRKIVWSCQLDLLFRAQKSRSWRKIIFLWKSLNTHAVHSFLRAFYVSRQEAKTNHDSPLCLFCCVLTSHHIQWEKCTNACQLDFDAPIPFEWTGTWTDPEKSPDKWKNSHGFRMVMWNFLLG